MAVGSWPIALRNGLLCCSMVSAMHVQKVAKSEVYPSDTEPGKAGMSLGTIGLKLDFHMFSLSWVSHLPNVNV